MHEDLLTIRTTQREKTLEPQDKHEIFLILSASKPHLACLFDKE